jgi:hypothetical protein
MYSDTEKIRELLLTKKNKIKLFNSIKVACFCKKDILAINYKKHAKSKYHIQYNYQPPYYNKLFFYYI